MNPEPVLLHTMFHVNSFNMYALYYAVQLQRFSCINNLRWNFLTFSFGIHVFVSLNNFNIYGIS